jgi:hypothetical protein
LLSFMLMLPSCVVQIIGGRKEHEGLWRHDRRMLIGTAVGTKPHYCYQIIELYGSCDR